MTGQPAFDGSELSHRTTRFSSAWREYLDIKLDRLMVDVSSLPPSAERRLAEHYLSRARRQYTARPRRCGG